MEENETTKERPQTQWGARHTVGKWFKQNKQPKTVESQA